MYNGGLSIDIASDDVMKAEQLDPIVYTKAQPIAASYALFGEDLMLNPASLVNHQLELADSTSYDVGTYIQHHLEYATGKNQDQDSDFNLGRLVSIANKRKAMCQTQYDGMDDIKANQFITRHHLDKAQEISEYYKSKFTMMKIEGAKMNGWQTILMNFLDRNDPGAYKETETGLLGTLAYHYQNDLNFDMMAEQCNTDSDIYTPQFEFGPETDRAGRPRTGLYTTKADLIGGQLSLSRKNKKVMLYFKTDRHNKMVTVPMAFNSAAKFLLRYLVEHSSVMLTPSLGSFVKKNNERYYLTDTQMQIDPIL